MPSTRLAALEICSGAGGQAAGLEAAAFDLAAAVEIDQHACRTLRTNRPEWQVIESDVREVDGCRFRGIDLFAAGVPASVWLSKMARRRRSSVRRVRFPCHQAAKKQ